MFISDRVSIYLQVIIANVLWGFSFVWTEIALSSFLPITITVARLTLATVLLFFVAKAMKKFHPIKRGDLKWFAGLALFEPFLYFLFETYGQTMVSPTITSVIIALIPLGLLIAGNLILKEKITFVIASGVAISLTGVVIVVLDQGGSFSARPLGVLLIFGAVITAVFYSIILKRITNRYNSIMIVFYQNLIGLLYFLPLLLIFDVPHWGEKVITLRAINSIILLSVFASVIAFIFHSNGVRSLGVTRAGIFANLIPVLTAFFSFLIIGEELTYLQVFGIFIVVLGLYLSQLKIKKR